MMALRNTTPKITDASTHSPKKPLTNRAEQDVNERLMELQKEAHPFAEALLCGHLVGPNCRSRASASACSSRWLGRSPVARRLLPPGWCASPIWVNSFIRSYLALMSALFFEASAIQAAFDDLPGPPEVRSTNSAIE